MPGMTTPTPRKPPNGGEKIWKWILRLCAVGGFVTLLIAKPDWPGSVYILLIGLFFGPELITGKVKLVVTKEEEEEHEGDENVH